MIGAKDELINSIFDNLLIHKNLKNFSDADLLQKCILTLWNNWIKEINDHVVNVLNENKNDNPIHTYESFDFASITSRTGKLELSHEYMHK